MSLSLVPKTITGELKKKKKKKKKNRLKKKKKKKKKKKNLVQSLIKILNLIPGLSQDCGQQEATGMGVALLLSVVFENSSIAAMRRSG